MTDFVINHLLPVLGTTVVGMVLIILFFLIVIVLTILIHIKEYKEIKANLIELKDDVKKNFFGTNNKKKRKKVASILSILLIVSFIISATYLHIQRPKQLVIEYPTEKTILNVNEETVIAWEPIPGTVKYFVSIYPTSPGLHNPFEQYQFYVDGDKSGVKLVISKFIYGAGPYNISVSSDVANTQSGIIPVYLTADLPETEQANDSDEN